MNSLLSWLHSQPGDVTVISSTFRPKLTGSKAVIIVADLMEEMKC